MRLPCPLATRTSPYLGSVAGKALMRDCSAVIIQLLDTITMCMLYSSTWDVNDFSAFSDLQLLWFHSFCLSHGEVLCKLYEINDLSIETRS
jgi:hypothetical protein